MKEEIKIGSLIELSYQQTHEIDCWRVTQVGPEKWLVQRTQSSLEPFGMSATTDYATRTFSTKGTADSYVRCAALAKVIRLLGFEVDSFL